MPGYDRTGPMGGGARTGRGLGLCNRPADGAASTESSHREDAADTASVASLPWPGGRGLRFRGGGRRRGRGRGFGRARGAFQNQADFDGDRNQNKTFLTRQVEALTAQLIELKKLMSKASAASGSNDRE